MVMIRPRGGNFSYSADELEIMRHDIEWARKLGADGVVFGCIRNQLLDTSATNLLLDTAHAPNERILSVTFHMAFDEIHQEAQSDAFTWLASHGVDRVLTHGGALSQPISSTLTHLKTLAEQSRRIGISILPGGGVTWENAESVAQQIGVSEVHGTRVVKL